MNTNKIFSEECLRKCRQSAQAAMASEVGLEAVVVATIDGFEIVSAVSGPAQPERIAALASSIASIGSVATQEAGLGHCSNMILNTERGFAVVRQFEIVKREVVMIVVADGFGLLAQVMYRANQLAKEFSAAGN